MNYNDFFCFKSARYMVYKKVKRKKKATNVDKLILHVNIMYGNSNSLNVFQMNCDCINIFLLSFES